MSSYLQENEIRLSDLLNDKWLPAEVGDIAVNGLCLDHRKLESGELFFAVKGTVNDGRRFIAEAIERGAAAVLKEACSEDETIAWKNNTPIIPFDNLPEKISSIAGRYYSEPSTKMAVVGITGTNGKTTCSYLLAQLFSLLGDRSGVVGTLGFGVAKPNDNSISLTDTGMTTSDAISTQKILSSLDVQGCDFVAMEVSSHSLDQHRVASVNFTTAVFTNLTRDHLDYHGDMHAYGSAKRQLFVSPLLKNAIINIDDDFGRRLVKAVSSKTQLITYSLQNDKADVYLSDVVIHQDGMTALLSSPWGGEELKTQLIGEFNLLNILAVISAACIHGYELSAVLDQLPFLRPVDGRMERVCAESDVQVIVDYAHTPDSLEKALETIKRQATGKLWCVFGCGGDRDKGKRPLMAQIAEKFADSIVVTSDNPRTESMSDIENDIKSGFKTLNAVSFVSDRAQAIGFAIKSAVAGDSILIAGKGHENYQLIGADRLSFSDVNQARLSLRERNKSV
ncbi:MAG: UDP-N-acetylmuramoyl-L-alanyl-D-glutamate--2,6-diaminopimelate ligase [Cellvibrionaceae bacterium]